MSKTNTAKDRLSENDFDDSDDLQDQGVDECFDSDAPGKVERIKHKINGQARRQYEILQENLRLKALIDGDCWC